MKKSYQGGCHCGKVRFEATLDLAKGTFKCNCPICWKSRLWGASAESFTLLQGEADLQDYQYKPTSVHHVFCRTCAVRSFAWADAPGKGRMHVVRVNCLDEVDVEELMAAPVQYFDGAHDNFKTPPAETRHL